MKRLGAALRRWYDSGVGDVGPGAAIPGGERSIDWSRVVPFLLLHVACLGVIWTGTSIAALVACAALFVVRMFAITAFYHRYFSHGAFRTSRAAQFAFAVMGASAVQRGPLWWASHHRHHHAYADRPADSHSALQHGFLWSHLGWFLSRGAFATRHERVRDLSRYPELRWLDRYDAAVPALLAIVLFAAGGMQMVVWGFCISTVLLYHATFTINSLAHRLGTRRYDTRDDSRNNAWLALLTFGEGWHNNHHRYPASARQGFFWWEVDLSYYGLRLLAATGLIWDLRPVPAEVLAGATRSAE